MEKKEISDHNEETKEKNLKKYQKPEMKKHKPLEESTAFIYYYYMF